MTTKKLNRNVLQGLLTRAALTIFSAMLLLQLPACVEEQITPPDNEKTITFSLSVPQNFTPASYTLQDADENNIETIDVLIFDSNTGNYFSGPHYGSLAGENVTIRIPESVDVSNSDIEVFANSRKIINDASSYLITSNTKATIFAQLTLEQTGKWITNTTDANYIHIPMHGQMVDDGANKTASLVRMLARVNVDAIDAVPTFTLAEIYLCNRNTKGYIANTGGVLDSPPASNNPLLYDGADVTGNACKNKIYIFEVESGGEDDLATNPCIVIGGTYAGATYYYRIDFVDKDENGNIRYIDIKRNHSYNISIARIYGPGYSSFSEAFNSKPINIDATVNEWDEEKIVDAVFDGENILGASNTQFRFNSDARGNNNGDNILTIHTNHPGGWQSSIQYFSGAGWLRLIDANGTIVTESNNGVTTVKLGLDINYGLSRSAVITFTAGSMIYSINVIQDYSLNNLDFIRPEADAYTMRPNGDKIMIPVSRANASEIKLGSSDEFTVEVVGGFTLADNSMPVSIKTFKPVGVGSSGYVYVETEGSGSSTNSVTVQIKDKDGIGICSWDINVREQDANCYIVRAGSSILIPISQIRNFEQDLVRLTSNNNQPIADQATADAWFDENDDFDAALVWADVAGGSAGDSQDATFANSIVSTIIKGTGFDDGFVRVDVGAGIKEGNAVVAVLQNGSIRWSWHIWVTEATPSVSGPNGFMDRNLGSMNNTPGDLGSFGLYYQFGRKDPFPALPSFPTGVTEATIVYGADIPITADINKDANAGGAGVGLANQIGKVNVVTNLTTNSTYTLASRFDGTNNNVDYAVANPHIFYFMTETLYEWYYSGGAYMNDSADNQAMQNNNLWGGYVKELSYKTAFDPCPAGWRIPRSSQLGTGDYPASSFAWNNSTSPWTGANVAPVPAFLDFGRTWPAFGGYYPAAGVRFPNSGDFGGVSMQGYYWSASPCFASGNRNAGSLFFNNTTTVSPANGDGRADGVSVRCVKE